MEMYGYRAEELIEIVASLASRYGGCESSSVTYELAGQLMEAVLYCIREGQQKALLQGERISAREAYRFGYEAVVEKVGKLRDVYHHLLDEFCSCGNVFLEAVVYRGIPEFLRRYDPVYEPQNTWLTLDYPILADISGLCGIDAVYEYARCLSLEQRFLRRLELSAEGVWQKLERQRHLPENVCYQILEQVIGSMRKAAGSQWFAEQMEMKIKELLYRGYPGDEELVQYLKPAVHDLMVRLTI